jgi:hypothetical protein
MASTGYNLRLETDKDHDIIRYLDGFKDDSERNIIIKKALRTQIESEGLTKKMGEQVDNIAALVDRLLGEMARLKRTQVHIGEQPADIADKEFLEAEQNVNNLLLD